MAAPSGADAARMVDRIVATVREAGNLGITSSQLARTMGASPEALSTALAELRDGRRLVRVGHGLWVDPVLIADPSKGQGYLDPQKFLDEFSRKHRLTPEPFGRPIQFRPNTEEPVHRWWPYVQGFSAEFVRTVLDRHEIGPGATVLDPFAGSGTVPAVARTSGAASVGVELMPISAFVAAAKQAWDANPNDLRRCAGEIVRSARTGPMAPLPFLRETRRQFAPGPLGSLRRLRAALESSDLTGDVGTLLRLAFARILVDSSRMRRSPCLGYGPKAPVPSSAPFRLYEAAVERTAQDLQLLAERRPDWGPRARILEEDSRSAKLGRGTVDLAVTSPPYVNGMDYVMNYKLELAWLGFVESYADLRALKNRMVACDNLPRSAAARGWGDAGLRDDPWIGGVLKSMGRNLRSKSTYRRSDMDAVVLSYFADLRPVVRRVFEALRPGGRFVVVNGDSFLAGVYVPGDLIFGRIAEAEGFEISRFEVARTRRSGQRRDILLRESILSLRRPPR